MAWSNIFCQIIGPMGPVVGEGMLSGWWTSIELEGFEWSLSVEQQQEARMNFGGAMKQALATANPFRGVKYEVKTRDLKFRKRFDIASSELHLLMDQKLPILSVSITVLHISPVSQLVHLPGFVILCTDCKIKEVDVKMERGDKGVEVKEDVTVRFETITITYLRSIPGVTGQVPLPMPPFIYTRPKPDEPGGLIPSL